MLLDGNEETCIKYWPDRLREEIHFGETSIMKQSEHQIPEVPGLTRRRLEILTEGSHSWHVVHQYHYTTWPEHHNLERSSKSIIALCKQLRTILMKGNGVCAVHCNDSVGRTGVLIGKVVLLFNLYVCFKSRVLIQRIYTPCLGKSLGGTELFWARHVVRASDFVT